MRRVSASLCAALLGLGLAATAPALAATQGVQAAKIYVSATVSREWFHYDADTLTMSYRYRLGAARFGLAVTNPFAIAELEPPGGVYLGDQTLLTSELQGLDVDTAGEPAIFFNFDIAW